LSALFVEKAFTPNEMELGLADSGTMKLTDLVAVKVLTNIAGSGKVKAME
jgi:hypothetical protein